MKSSKVLSALVLVSSTLTVGLNAPVGATSPVNIPIDGVKQQLRTGGSNICAVSEAAGPLPTFSGEDGYYMTASPVLTASSGAGYAGMNIPALHQNLMTTAGYSATANSPLVSITAALAFPVTVTTTGDLNNAFRFIVQTGAGFYHTGQNFFGTFSSGSGFKFATANAFPAASFGLPSGAIVNKIAAVYIGGPNFGSGQLYLGELNINTNAGNMHYYSGTNHVGINFQTSPTDPVFNTELSINNN